ncbi:MAG: hypothetical protein GY835_26140 [bacterium]|nr:hypothetical protein [bacterium]
MSFIPRSALSKVLVAAPFLLQASSALAQEEEVIGWGIVSDNVAALILFTLFSGVVLYQIGQARRGKELFIRRIAGLNAVEEAIGRSTELGRKVMFVPGIGTVGEVETLSALSVLKHVAKHCAEYGTPLEVPNKDPLTYAAAREAVKEAYLEAGRPDLFNEEMVPYLTYDQFAFTAQVTGKMVREKPAANFLIGSFFAESLLLAEAGQSTGAIQIAGTAQVAQLPFFVTTCDYTLIGEELYAASAYLSKDPVMLGCIKGQDIVKAIVLLWIVIGILVLSATGSTIMQDLLNSSLGN